MSQRAEGLAARLRERFGDALEDCQVDFGQVTVEVAAARLREVCSALRDEDDFAFEQAVDLCGVDYLDYGRADWETSDMASASGFSRGVERRVFDDRAAQRPRYAVVYHLLSVRHNQRLRVRAFAPGDPPRVESLIAVWNGPHGVEREVFDLFGILFDGHPDLRRILTDYGFVGHPFRKDFPVSGEVEMRYDPDKRRVVYEPVTIEPRTLVPRVIRHDARYDAAVDEDAGDA